MATERPRARVGEPRVIIAVSGPPGTGTTTLSRALSERLGWPHYYAGQLFRQMAKEAGKSLAEFSRYAEENPEVDRELDQRVVDLIRTTPDAILEGRLAAWHVQQAGVPALKVLLTASADVRAKRVAEREGKRFEEVLHENAEREASEAKRYREIYGMNPSDPAHYGLVIDTSQKTPRDVQELVVAALPVRGA